MSSVWTPFMENGVRHLYTRHAAGSIIPFHRNHCLHSASKCPRPFDTCLENRVQTLDSTLRRTCSGEMGW